MCFQAIQLVTLSSLLSAHSSTWQDLIKYSQCCEETIIILIRSPCKIPLPIFYPLGSVPRSYGPSPQTPSVMYLSRLKLLKSCLLGWTAKYFLNKKRITVLILSPGMTEQLCSFFMLLFEILRSNHDILSKYSCFLIFTVRHKVLIFFTILIIFLWTYFELNSFLDLNTKF